MALSWESGEVLGDVAGHRHRKVDGKGDLEPQGLNVGGSPVLD